MTCQSWYQGNKLQELSSSVWFKLGYITTLQMQLFNLGKMIYTILAIVTKV